jgi:predicted nuclease of predicted toxin-antitoxin system
VSLPELYLDEDSQSGALIAALRSRGIALVTTSEAGMSNRTDEAQLRFAASANRVMITSNIADFARLHADWLKAGFNHSGIILIHQQKWGPGELARRIIRLLAGSPRNDMRNRMEFLSNW